MQKKLYRSKSNRMLVGVCAGVALIIYGASELLSSWRMRKAIDESENEVDEQ